MFLNLRVPYLYLLKNTWLLSCVATGQLHHHPCKQHIRCYSARTDKNNFSRRGAKTQRKNYYVCVLLRAFASLRELFLMFLIGKKGSVLLSRVIYFNVRYWITWVFLSRTTMQWEWLNSHCFIESQWLISNLDKLTHWPILKKTWLQNSASSTSL